MSRWLVSPPTNGAATVALAGVLAVIVVQLLHRDGAADSTALGLVMIAAPLLFAVLAPRQTGRVVSRVTNFKVAGVEVGLAIVTSAERIKPPGAEGDDVEVKRTDQGYEEIGDEMRQKLRFAWAITDLKGEVADKYNYYEVAWRLRAGKLIDDEEARFILDLLSERDFALTGLPEAAKDEFLDAAWVFAKRFGSMVWDRHVRRELTRMGTLVLDFAQKSGHRPDFLAHRNGHWVALAPRVGGAGSANRYPATRRRLAKLNFPTPLAGRCIVIPRGRRATVISKNGKGASDAVKVLEFQGSLRDFPIRAFDTSPVNQDAERK